jgi:hypothetical protein
MALPPADQALIAFKHVFLKPHTSPNFQKLANEAFNVGFSSSVKSIFAEPIVTSPTKTLYWNDGTIEYVRLEINYIPGTNTSDGQHGFEVSLPSDYETNSTNPKKGVFPFFDNQTLQTSQSLLQIIPEGTGGDDYRVTLYDETTSQIYPLDSRDWIIYPYGGIVFQNNPPTTGASTQNPGYVDAFIYIGAMTSERIATQVPSIIDTVTASSSKVIHSLIATEEKSVVYNLTAYKEGFGSASYEVRTVFDYATGNTDITVNNITDVDGLVDVSFSVAFNNMDIELTMTNNDASNDYEVSGVSEFLVSGFNSGVEIPTNLIVTDPDASTEADAISILTQGEYDAIAVKNPNTIYFIK